MRSEPAQRGVCVVIVDRHSTGLLITLVERPDVEETTGEVRRSFADSGPLLAAVADFIRRFEHSATA